MTQSLVTSTEPDQILREVLEELTPQQRNQYFDEKMWNERVRRLRPLLAYACRLQIRAGLTFESEEALRRFAHSYLSGHIPLFD